MNVKEAIEVITKIAEKNPVPPEPRCCLIWSIEHHAWWMPARNGYTKVKDEAGRYSLREAREICENANRFVRINNPPNEAIVFLD